MNTDEDENENNISRQRKTHVITRDGTKWIKQCGGRNVHTRQHNLYTNLPGINNTPRGFNFLQKDRS